MPEACDQSIKLILTIVDGTVFRRLPLSFYICISEVT
jgi:hypothetical protein